MARSGVAVCNFSPRNSAGATAGRGEGRAVEATGEREGQELGAVAHLAGEAEDEGGEEGQLQCRRLRRPPHDQPGGAGEEQREGGQQGRCPNVDQLRDIDAGDRGDGVAGGERHSEAGEDEQRPLRSLREHRGHELRLVAPAREQGGDEAGDEGVHRVGGQAPRRIETEASKACSAAASSRSQPIASRSRSK